MKSSRHRLTLPSQLQLISRKKRIPYQQQFRPKYKTASISSLNFFSSLMLADVLNRFYHLNQAKVPYFEKYQLNLGYLSDQGLCGENEEGDDGRELESYWGKLVEGRSTKVRDFLRYRSQPKFQPLWCFDVQRSCPVMVNLLSIPGLADWILSTTM